MTTLYFDASALVKYYLDEQGSWWMRDAIDAKANGLYANTITMAWIGVVEVAAALARRHRMGTISSTVWEVTLGVFLSHSRTRYSLVHLEEGIYNTAVGLTKSHPLRGYDAVHLATALVLNRKLLRAGLSGLTFVSADKTLCKAAEAEGLRVVNPDEM